MKPAPPQAPKRKDLSRFNRDQISEDTERSMTGRPQRFGAADDDEAGAPPAEQAQPSRDVKTPDQQGVEPEQQGLEEQGPGEPGDAESREMAEGDVDQMPNDPQSHHNLLKKHHGGMHDLHKRIAALEAKNGGAGHEPPSGSGPGSATSQSGPDQDGY